MKKIYGLCAILLGIGLYGEASAQHNASQYAEAREHTSSVTDSVFASMHTVLVHLAQTRDLKLAYAPELVAAHRTACTSLPADDEKALDCILAGSGLTFGKIRQDTYVIQKPRTEAGSSATRRGHLQGVVQRVDTGERLQGAHVQVMGLPHGAATNPEGTFYLAGLPEGVYDLEVTMMGYAPLRYKEVHIRHEAPAQVVLGLQQTTLPLEGVVITEDNRSQRFFSPDSGYGVLDYQGMQLGPVAAGVLLSARPGSIEGVQFAGLGSLSRKSLNGVQLAGLFNSATEDSRGVQMGGLVNNIGESMDGSQFAGILNTTSGELNGGQFGGVANHAGESIRGVQAAGVANRVGGTFKGVQVAGVVNLDHQWMRGVQLAGVSNVARSVNGVQVAGVVNNALGSVRGAQLAVINTAGPVEGFQLGLVNVSSSNTGLPLGLVSYVKDIGLRYDLYVDETGRTTVALRSGTRGFSNYLGFSTRPDDVSRTPAFVAGLGGEFYVRPALSFAIDGLYHGFGVEDATDHLMKTRLLVRYRLHRAIGLFGGPSLNLLLSDEPDYNIAIPWRFEQGRWGSRYYDFWAGFAFGVSVYGK